MNVPVFLKNWETSAAGILAIGVYFLSHAYLSEEAAMGLAILILGVGQVLARDGDKSSQDTGLRQ